MTRANTSGSTEKKGKPAGGLSDEAHEHETKGADDIDDQMTDNLFNQELLQEIHQAEKDLLEIDESRSALNARKQEIMARLIDRGLNKDALKAAVKFFRTPEDKRKHFDLTYQICRKALGVPVQDDLFVAAAQRAVDQHQKGKH